MFKSFALRLLLVGILLASLIGSQNTPVLADKAGVCATPGKDGVNNALRDVINTYYPGSASVAAGATSIPVGTARTGGGAAIAAGDLLLVVQMQGADINATNTNNYGDGVGNGGMAVNTIDYSATANDYAGGHLAANFVAGIYEYVVAAGPVNAGALPITTGLSNAYVNADFGAQGQRRFQVIRVPQYSTARLDNALTALRWNGATGGIVVFDVAGQLNWNNQTINVAGMGFRGGGGRQLAGDTDTDNWWDFLTLSTDNANGAKGEGYAGTPRYVNNNGALLNTGAEGYPNGSSGRGGGGNGGGGSTDGRPNANDQNSGGGGGGNGGYGGRGGNSWQSGAQSGGYGGAPFPGSAPRLILGGGGGAGTTNDGTGDATPNGFSSSGAAGGGVVFVRAGSITGTGTINANGASADSTVDQDGGGGGGAGGSVVVISWASTVGNLTINARGGSGGSTWTGQAGAASAHGPGGGGGGGFVYSTGAIVNPATAVTGGANGLTTTGNLPFGATAGSNGVLSTGVAPWVVPGAIAGANCLTINPTVTKTTSTALITQTATGVTGTYTILVSLPAGSGWANGVTIADTLPTGAPGTITYASTGAVTLTGAGTTRTATADPTVGTTTPTWGTFDIAPGGSVSITFTVNFSATVPAGTYQNPATASYLDPDRATSTDRLTASYDSASSSGENITVQAAADLQITKTDGVTNVRPGNTLSYSVVVTNRGPSAANNTVLTDPAITGLNVTGVTCGSASAGAVCPTVAATTVALLQGTGIVIPTLPNGGSLTFTITATVTATTGSLANTATVTPPAGTTDPGVYANTATDTDSVSDPRIAMVKAPATQSVVTGSNVSFTLTVTNPGNVALSTVSVTDATCSTGPTRISGDTNSNNILETSETWVYSCTVNNVTADFTNTASAVGTPPTGAAVNASDSATVTVLTPAVTLDKTGTLNDGVIAPAGVVNAGDTITYAFTVTNSGNVTLTNITLADTVGGVTISGGPIGSLAAGASDATTFTGTYTLTQADVNAGTFTNTATVTANPPIGAPITDSDDDTQTLTAAPAIDIQKDGTAVLNVVAPDTQLDPGDQITYIFTVTNTGNVTLTNITLVDMIGGVTITGSSIPSLAPGASDNTTFSGVYTLTQADIDAGSFNNTARVSGNPPAGDPVTDMGSNIQFLPAVPAITLEKTGTLDLDVIAPAGVANAGDTITYAFTVTNTGNVTLTNITLADTVGGVTITGGPILSLAPGDSDTATFTGTYTLTQADVNAGTFGNTATVSGNPPTGAPVTDADGDTQMLAAAPALSLVKTGALNLNVVAPNGIANPGDQISYAFTVTNSGNVTLSDVTLSDAIGGVTITGGPILTLQPGASDTTTFTGLYTLTQADINAGTFSNTATVSADLPTGDPISASDDETLSIVRAPALSLVKSVTSSAPYTPGGSITYQITATNTGNQTLTGVSITDAGVGVTLGVCAPAQPATLLPGEALVCAASHTVTQTDVDAGGYTNTASADSDQTAPVSDDVNVTIARNPAVTLAKTGTLNLDVVAPNGIANAGDTITYAFTVTNTGNVTLTNLTISDTVGGVTIAGGPIATLAPGAEDNSTFTGSYTLTQTDINAGMFGNTATVSGNPPTGDAVTDDDGDTQTLPAAAAMQLDKTGTLDMTVVAPSGVANAGDTITYAFTVTNLGNVTLTNVTLTDTVGGVTITGGPIASLAPGASDNTTFTGSYTLTQTDINAGTFGNVATATANPPSGDPLTATDSDIQTLLADPAVTLEKTGTLDMTVVAPSGVANAGDTVTYAFTITNTGNVTLSNITLTDTIGGVTISGGPIASLAPGASDNTTFTGTYTLTQTDINAGTFSNTATASGNPPSGDAVTDSDGDTQTLVAAPAIELIKTGALNLDVVAPNGEANPGDTITYTFTVTNTGNVTLTNVTLADTVGGVTITGGPIASLAPGVSNSTTFTGSYTLAQTDIDAGVFTNTATVNANPPTGDPIGDSDDETLAIARTPALSLSKTATSSGPYVSGNSITYEIVATNTGNQTLTGVTITDAGVGVTLGVCAPAQPANLAPGATLVCAASHAVTQPDIDAGVYANTAVADSVETAPVSDGETVGFPAAPTIDLQKDGTAVLNVVAPDTELNVGDQITYVFTVTNTGNVTLTNITLVDLDDVTVTGGPIASLAPGASDNTTFTGVYTLTQADLDAGTYLNTAEVSGTPPTGAPVTDQASNNQLLPAVPAVTLEKTGTLNLDVVEPNGIANPGDRVSYTFTVTNTGNVTLTNITLADTVGGVTITGGPILSLAPGSSDTTTFTGVYTLTQTDVDAGTFSNLATVTANPPSGDAVTDSDGDTRTIPVAPALGLTKTVTSSGPYALGSVVTYSLVATNTGNTTLTDVTISDSDALLGACTPAQPATLLPGETLTCSATHTLTQTDMNAGGFANTATADSNLTDPVTDDANISITRSPAVTLEKTGTLHLDTVAPAAIANPGDTITYAFTVTNSGNVTLTNITLADTIGGVTISGGPISSLAPGVSDSTTFTGSYTLTQADIDAGSFTNTATANADAPGGSSASDDDDDTQTIPALPALALTKTVTSSGPYGLGDVVTYELVATNTGAVTLANVTISDSGATLGTCTPAQPATLLPGESLTCPASHTLTQTDVDAGSYANTATADSDRTAPVSADASITIARNPAITLAKTGTLNLDVVAPSGVANAGDTITYAFTITNTGNVTLSNITLADTLGGVTITGGPLATLAPLASDTTTFTGSYTLTQADINAGTFTNTATASGNPPGGAPAVTDDDDDTQTITAAAEITLAKMGTLNLDVVAPAGIANAGDTITYAFTVTNTGNVTLSNVTLADTVGGVTITGGPIASLEAGMSDTTTFTGSYTLTQADINAGSFSNTASVSGNPPSGDPVTDTDGDTRILPAAAALNLVKSGTLDMTVVAPGSVTNAGDTISYAFTVTNTGNVTLTNITLADTVGGVTISGGPILSLLPGASDTTTFTGSYTLTQADVNAGTFTNTATVSGNPPSGDPVTDDDDDTLTLPAVPALTLAKSGTLDMTVVAPGSVTNAGDQINYTFTVTNTGNVTLTNITLADTVGGVTISGGPILSLLPGASDTTTFTGVYTLTQTDVNAGTFSNTATASGNPPSGDPVTDDDDDTQTLPAAASLTLAKTGTLDLTVVAPGTLANAGDTITYAFTVTNTGNVTLTNVNITDTVGGVTISGGPVTLNPGEADTITFTGVYTLTQADINAGSFTNMATASGNPPSGAAVTGNDDDTQTLPSAPAIELLKTGTLDSNVVAPNGVANAGDQINYTFAITNTGNVTLTGITVTDTVGGVTISGGPIASLAPGATDNTTISGVYTLTQADINAGTFTNTATASGNPPGGAAAVTDDDADVQSLPAAPAIELLKSGTLDTTIVAPTGVANVGDQITYTFTVTNTGNVTLTNITLADTVGGVTITGGPIASLAPGASDTATFSGVYTLTQTDVDAGTFSNIATVTASPPSGDAITDSDGDTQTIPAAAAIELLKTGTLDLTVVAPNGEANPGDQITYTFTVTNTGNVTLSNVTLADTVGGVTISGGPIASLAPGDSDSATFTGVYTLTQTDIDAGTFTNTATASGNPPGGAAAVTDDDNDTRTIPTNPALDVTKTVQPGGPYVLGSTIYYDVVVTNTGNVTLTNVSVSDPGTGAVLESCDVAAPITLAPGASVNCVASHLVTQPDVDAGSYTNTAVAGSDQSSDDSDDETVTFPAAPSIELLKTGTLNLTVVAPDTVVNAGDQITYTFTVTNTGNVTLHNLTISDTVGGVTISGGPLASLAPLASDTATFTGSYTLTQADINAGIFTNTATASGTPPVGGAVTDDDDDAQTLTADPAIELVKTGALDMTVIAPDGVANVGDVINYTFTVTNTGNVTLTNITLADTIGGVAISGGPILSLDPGDVDNTTFTGTYTLTQADVNTGSFANTATATGTPPGAGSNPVMDEGGYTQPIAAVPAIQLEKTGTLDLDNVAPDNVANVGDTISYAFTVTNTGNVTLYNITLSDTIGGVTITGGPILELAPTDVDSTTFTGSYTLTQADINAEIFSNTATVTGETPDGDPVSSEDDVDTDLPVAPALGVAKQVVGAPVSVSTGVYDVTFEILVRNYGNQPISALQVTDDLSETFPAPTIFTVQSVTSAEFAVNPAYNGASDANLLLGTDTLDLTEDGTITLVVRVTPADGGPFENTAVAAGETPLGNPVDDDSQDGANPDPDDDGNPENNDEPTPVDFGSLFDPPFGVKTFDENRLPLLRWNVVWINNANIQPIHAASSDPIPQGSRFYDDGVPSGYPLPSGTLPVGTTTNGVACLDSSAETTTTYCYYEGPTSAYPRGRIVWEGVLGDDYGITDPLAAQHDIQITFAVRVNASATSVNNTATADADLNGDGDVSDPGETLVAEASAVWVAEELPDELPDTGFAPNRVTRLPAQPAERAYRALDDLRLEIPALKVNAPIVGVPLQGKNWQLDWLGGQIGHLDGTAFPTWNGNSVLTAHVYDANGKPGPFVNLSSLRWGQQIIVRLQGQKYTFEVRSVRTQVSPDADVITHEETPVLTLVTCQGYDQASDSYDYRVVVRAVLVKVE